MTYSGTAASDSRGGRRAALAQAMYRYYAEHATYHQNVEQITGPRPTDEESQLFAAVAPLLPTGDRPIDVMELGCGTAESAPALMRMLGVPVRYTGIDASETAIRGARSRHPEWTFHAGDIAALPFPDLSFDLVFFNFVLEHAVYPDRVLSEAARILRSGGVMAMIAPVCDLPWVLPSSLRDRQRDVRFVLRAGARRWLDLLRLRYTRDFFSFRVVDDPIALRSPAGEFQPDDDQVYWGSSIEIRKWLMAAGCPVVRFWGRPIASWISSGRVRLLDAARRVAFAALRASLAQFDERAYTTTAFIVAVKR